MKSLKIPSRIWTDINEFLHDFPFTRTPILLAHILKPAGGIVWCKTKRYSSDCRYFSVMPLPCSEIKATSGGLYVRERESFDIVSSWDMGRKIQVYNDIIRNALSTEIPMTVQLAVNLTNFKPGIGPGPLHELAIYNPNIWRRWMTYDHFLPVSAYNTECLRHVGLTGYFTGDLRDEIGAYKSQVKKPAENELIDRVTNFRATTPTIYRDFNEVYGISNINEVPPYTISYVVEGKPPPIDESIDFENPQFWSAVFNLAFGKAILNAVAMNMPVKVKTTVTNWKNPDLPSFSMTEDSDMKRYLFEYVWQDFHIEIGPNFNMIVRYRRGMESGEVIERKRNAWGYVLKFVVMAVAMLGAGVALSALAAAAAVAPVAAPVTGIAGTSAATGLTLPAFGSSVLGPGIAAPVFTGVSAGVSATGVLAPTLAATGIAAPVFTGVSAGVSATGVLAPTLAATGIAAPAVVPAGTGIFATVAKTVVTTAAKIGIPMAAKALLAPSTDMETVVPIMKVSLAEPEPGSMFAGISMPAVFGALALIAGAVYMSKDKKPKRRK